MLTLGLSGTLGADRRDLFAGLPDYFFHDAAACLVQDGRLIAAVEEERFNRIKKTNKFPINAIRYCLSAGDVDMADIDGIGYYFGQQFTDLGLNSLYLTDSTQPLHYSTALLHDQWSALGGEVPLPPVVHVDHHESHALSSFVRSGFNSALVVVLDARGDNESGTVYSADAAGLTVLCKYSLGDSLGTFYESATHPIGYRFGDEYKLMGLAPYGDPSVYMEHFNELYSLLENGRYTIHQTIPDFDPVGSHLFTKGIRPRRAGEPFSQQDMDVAASTQSALEDIVMHILTHWQTTTGHQALCFSGGIAHNSTLNGRILESALFDKVFVHPASHDAGAAEGAALGAAIHLGAHPAPQPQLESAALGPDPSDVAQELARWAPLVTSHQVDDPASHAAKLVAGGEVIGWVQGRSEFGPRALGNRSILADARPQENKDRVNAMIKSREAYRPFAPIVTAQHAHEYFVLPETEANYSFMSFVLPVRERHRQTLGAVTHVDGTARVQVVQPNDEGRLHELLGHYAEHTGVPVLLNTSFNNNAEPIVQTALDAVTTFLTTGLDALIINDWVVRKTSESVPSSLHHLAITLRPQAFLSKQVNPTSDVPQTSYRIDSNYFAGDSREISRDLYSLIEHSGPRVTLAAAADAANVDLTARLRDELFRLWQSRLVAATPTSTCEVT